ncbi:hypothetical protein [Tropicimonas sp. S265A]|uniref:hypothetical protein n=1 Tax=Tropicimonas sp. S265A TaxID=3415134 RepID=UPI003C7E4A4C
MSSLALDRPSVSKLAASVMDAVFYLPHLVAHAHEMRAEAERIQSLSTLQLEKMGTTRDALLRELAQSA